MNISTVFPIMGGSDSTLVCRSLDYPSAETGGAVNGGTFAPFILTVDWLGRICYFNPFLYL